MPPKSAFTIETENLIIREWVVKDATVFSQLTKDPNLSSMAQSNLDLCERKIIEWALMLAQTKMGFLPVFLKDRKTLIGICGIKPLILDRAQIQEQMHFEIICKLSSAFTDKSYENEIIPAMMNYGFKDLGLKELVAVGSPAILEKVGMHFLRSISLQNKKVDLFSAASQ